MPLVVTNIQRSSFYDGPGIRTTVFLKGCQLDCPWCCNPECKSFSPQFYFKKEKCLREKKIHCDECVKDSPFKLGKLKDIVTEQIDYSKIPVYKDWVLRCPTQAIGIYGEIFEVDELVKLLKKDKHFYNGSGGGVTFSGGEPLLQAKELVKCLKELKKEGIHTCIETSLFCPSVSLDLVKELVDLFIVDIKILDPKECQKHLKGNLGIYLKNVEKIVNSKKNYFFRFPAVKPFTFNKTNIELLYLFLERWRPNKIEIFSIHNLGIEKYKSLGIEPLYFKKTTSRELNLLRKKLLSLKLQIDILTL